MRVSSRLLLSPATAIALTAVAIIVILFATNLITIANAQQPQQTTNQPSVTQNRASLFQSTRDSFRVQVPDGWVVRDIKNTGFSLLAEVLQGYGVLAQLCPEQQAGLSNVSSGGTYSGSSCQQAREEVIHIVRYPNLDARLGIASDDIFTIINSDTIPNAILAYHMQEFNEVGYRNIRIVSSTDTTIDVITTGLNNNRIAATTMPAKLVEITYTTDFDPGEIKRGYFILTATAATPRNLGLITGYSIFYEGNSAAETLASGSLVPIPLPASIRQVFDSFELIAAPTEPLIIEVTSSDTEGVAPATIEFEANVEGGMEPYTINWVFDDGSEEGGDDETIDHTFDEADTYTVTATVIDSGGRTVSDSILITVEAPPPLTSVDIISNDTEGVAPATIEFEANVTGGLEPYTYSWDFGDGSLESDDDETIDHTFDEAGTYNVDLTVIDSSGRTVSDSILITVEAPPPPPPPSPPLT
jgi:PKD repeat protein